MFTVQWQLQRRKPGNWEQFVDETGVWGVETGVWGVGTGVWGVETAVWKDTVVDNLWTRLEWKDTVMWGRRRVLGV